MVFALPTILEDAPGTMGGVAVPDTSGTEFSLRVWQVTGLTAAQYFRTLTAIYTGALLEAKWTFTRMGGAGSGYFKVQGGVADLDTAVQNEWEIDIVRGAGTLGTSGVWYRGRIVRYTEKVDANGSRVTEIWTEGYASKLAEIYFSETIAAGQTIKQAVQTIMSTHVTPRTRIRFDSSDVEGSYALATALSFKNQSVLSALHKLAMLQGSTEWGITEGGTAVTSAPAFYFKAQSTATSETAVLIMQAPSDLSEMNVGGSFEGAFNRVVAIGGYVSGAIITATSNDATAQGVYGIRPFRINWSALSGSTDAQRFADNYVAYWKDGNGFYTAVRSNPTERLEPDRTNASYGSGSVAIPASPKAQWWGDSSKVTEQWHTIDYSYEQGCPYTFKARCSGGLPRPDTVALVTGILDRIDDISNMFENPIHSGSGTANTIPKWTSATALGDSSVSDNGSVVTITSEALSINPGAATFNSITLYDSNYGIGMDGGSISIFTSASQGVTFRQSSVTGAQFGYFDADGFLRIGVNAGAAAAGDLSAGVSGSSLFLYDQSVPSISMTDGTNNASLLLSAVAGTATVFNEQGADLDFRVEGDTNANLLFVDASTDRVGIGTATPSTTLDVNGNTTSTRFLAANGSASAPSYSFTNATDSGMYGSNNSEVFFASLGSAHARIYNNMITLIPGLTLGWGAAHVGQAPSVGFINSGTSAISAVDASGTAHAVFSVSAGTANVFNETGADTDFRVEGDTDANLLFLDASADAVQIGGSAPTAFLHLKAGTTSKASIRFPASTAPTTPNEGDAWNDSTQKALYNFASGIKQAAVGCIFTQTADATVANTATETTLVGNGVGTVTLPANFFTIGKTIHLHASGYYSTDATAAQTLTIRVKYGSTVLLATAAIAKTQSLASRGWSLDVYITCRTTGATGTVYAQANGGFWHWGSATVPSVAEMVNAATVTIDTTAATALDVTADWNSADTGDTITCTDLAIQVKN